MSQEDNAIQAVETVGGFLSFVACAYMIYKFERKKGNDSTFTNKIFLMFFMINLPLSAIIAVGRSAIQNPGFCTFQGFVIQWLLNAYMLWIMLLSYLMHLWIVQKQHPKRMEKIFRKNVRAIIGFSFSLAIILLGVQAFGDAYIWCWIDSRNQIARFLCMELFLIVAWVVNTYSVVMVERALTLRFKRASFHEKISQILDSREVSIQQKLTIYLGVFSFISFFALLNRVVELVTNDTNFVTGLLEALFVPLQGFLYAICYYPVIQQYIWCIKPSKEVTLLRLGVIPNRRRKETPLREIFVEPTLSNMTVAQRTQKAYIPKKYSIYVTTFNMGEALPQLLQANIKDWVVEGHDVYVIGLQECMELAGLREMILNHLGGSSKYQMHGVAIGSDNKSLGFHGFIALTVYIKLSEVLDGSIIATSPAKSSMATGADLIITTAQNKGAVGIPLQIHDTSIGFVTCHLPSDSKGQSKLSKRNASAHAILKEVTLAPEDLGFDLHLQHDHVIVCGDLNYRMDTSGDGGGVNSLTGVAVACNIEKQAFSGDAHWIARKFNLLRHHTDPLYPSLSEVKVIHNVKSNSRGAWRSVLRADELRSIMDDGDAFCQFEEPMPTFPPSYKRRKGVEADCGDYSDFEVVIKGYSNTGYVENLLLRQQYELEKSEKERRKQIQLKSSSIKDTINAGCERIRRKSSFLTGKSAAVSDQSSGQNSDKSNVNNTLLTEGDEEKSAALSYPPSLASPMLDMNNVEPLDNTSSFRDNSSSLSPLPPTLANALDSPTSSSRKRRGGHENNIILSSKSEIEQHKEDPTKLRPPSYTDRVLVHSLPDRKERLTIQAYDSCDLIRVSDHRPVSMTLLLEVNAAVSYNECVHLNNDHSNAVASSNETNNSNKGKEPQFELYELIITNFSVVLIDLMTTVEDDDEDENDSNDDDVNDNNNNTNEGRDMIVVGNPADIIAIANSTKTEGRLSASGKMKRGSQFTAVNPLHAAFAVEGTTTADSHINNGKSNDSSSTKTVSTRLSQPQYDSMEDGNEQNNNAAVNEEKKVKDVEKDDDEDDDSNHGITLFSSSVENKDPKASTKGDKHPVNEEINTLDALFGSPSSPSKKKKKVGGIHFSDDLNTSDHDESAAVVRDCDYSPSQRHTSVSIELTSSSSKHSSRSHSSVTGSDSQAHGISFAGASVVTSPAVSTVTASSAGAAAVAAAPPRRKRMLYSLYLLASGKRTNDDDDNSEAKEKHPKDLVIQQKEQQQQEILDMARDSLAWQNTLHEPGEWRKKVIEEERQHREAKAANVKSALKTKVRQLRRKSNKSKGSTGKSIACVTIVFPLPAKDPLLSYRRAYDYAVAFGAYDDSSSPQRRRQQHRDDNDDDNDIESNNLTNSANNSSNTTTRDELLQASSIFEWHPLFSTDSHTSRRRSSQMSSVSGGAAESSKQRESKFDSCDTFKVKGCASTELGAHALLKVTAKDGSELGSSVVCVSHLLHVDPGLIKSSNMSQIPLSSGGQKRGHISGKFSLRYLPSSLSVHNNNE